MIVQNNRVLLITLDVHIKQPHRRIHIHLVNIVTFS